MSLSESLTISPFNDAAALRSVVLGSEALNAASDVVSNPLCCEFNSSISKKG